MDKQWKEFTEQHLKQSNTILGSYNLELLIKLFKKVKQLQFSSAHISLDELKPGLLEQVCCQDSKTQFEYSLKDLYKTWI